MSISVYKKATWISVGAILGAFIVIASSVMADRPQSPMSSEEKVQNVAIPLDELRAFAEVFERVSSDYVDAVEDKDLLEGAISGMLSSLDPHSAYLPAEGFKEMQESTKGEFGGLGMEVGMEDGFVKVISPIDDTPAQEAGIEAGDLIIKLGSEPVKGKTLGEAVDIMRGKPGTVLNLTLIRKGEPAPIQVDITRAVIKVKSIKQRMLKDNIGYVRVSQFQVRSGVDLIAAVKKLEKENGKDLSGLVLDLRNNPGGVLSAAVEISDAFMHEGLIVYTEGRIKNSQMRFEAEKGDVMYGKPVVVLINEGSASASEIVAGALQDQGRAIIVGRTSFGKGSVQTLLPLHNGAAIKVTTARYFTPNGRSIQAEGIEPDITIERVKLEQVEESLLGNVKEKDLTGHLENGSEGDESKKEDSAQTDPKEAEVKKKEAEIKALLEKDYELNEAVRVLKTMALTQKMSQR